MTRLGYLAADAALSRSPIPQSSYSIGTFARAQLESHCMRSNPETTADEVGEEGGLHHRQSLGAR
eukprot:9468044-Pyramimonas_sp.AAC.1